MSTEALKQKSETSPTALAVPIGDRALELLEIAYREGEVGLPVLLLIRNQVIDAELDYWAAWLAEREAAATLAEATALNTGDVKGPR